MTDISLNSFEAGLDLDSSLKTIQPNSMLDAYDVMLTKEGNLFNVVPRYGTNTITTLFTAFNYDNYESIGFSFQPEHGVHMNSMGIINCSVTVGGEKKSGIAMFVSRNKNTIGADTEFYFEIYLSYVNDGILSGKTLVYRQTVTNPDILTANVDGFRSTEGDFDVIYFTDGINELRKIKCTVDEGTFDDEDLRLVRTESVFPPYSFKLEDGGSIKSGKYFFAVRMINPDKSNTTKFSLIGPPVIVPSYGPSGNVLIGGIGTTANKKIKLRLTFPEETYTKYDYFQLAVIKQTEGTGTLNSIAYMLDPIEKGSNQFVNFDYTGDNNETQISIDELTIDDSSIFTANTVTVKDNFLIAGGVKYKDLSYDRGEVVISDTTDAGKFVSLDPSTVGTAKNYFDPDYDNIYELGYFRDEVYRFAITYHDEFGNWSKPQVLDFSAVTANRAEAGCVDFKFPGRDELNYSLSNASGQIENLFLDLNGIENHPTWARGFAILRSKRIKNIQFQSPIISTVLIEPPLVNDNFGFPTGGIPNNAEAEIANPLGTIAPKTLSKILPMHILRDDSDCKYYYGYPESVSAVTANTVKNITKSAPATKYVHAIFPPNDIYRNDGNAYEPYSHSSSDVLKIVDAAMLNRVRESLDDVTEYSGLDYKDNKSYASFAARPDLYYYKRTVTNPKLSSLVPLRDNYRVLEYGYIDENSEGSIIQSALPGAADYCYFGRYSNLETSGVGDLSVPVNQRMGYIVTDQEIVDPAYYSFSTGGASTTGDASLGQNVIPWRTVDKLVPSNLTAYTDLNDGLGYATPTTVENGNTIPAEGNMPVYIVNIEKGLSDFRYGDKNEINEFYYCIYRSLTESEVENNTPIDLDVKAGDCSIDYHTFKVNNTTMSVPLIQKGSALTSGEEDDIKEQWGNVFFSTHLGASEREMRRPVPLHTNSETISVFLESEIVASLAERTTHLLSIETGKQVSEKILTPKPSGASDARSNFEYIYNLDYSVGNYYKVWVSDNNFDNEKINFPSRLVYSDQRIYQTNELGFDRFRVGNIYDLDESSGEIRKLIKNKSELYSINSRSVHYIPVQGSIIETADGSSLSIRNAEVIGNPKTISSTYGTQHPRTVQGTGDSIIFVDANDKKVCRIQGDNLELLSMKKVKSFFDEKLDEDGIRSPDLVGYYDFGLNEYSLYKLDPDGESSTWGIKYSDILGVWDSKLTTGEGFSALSFTSFQGDSYILGKGLDGDFSLSRSARDVGRPSFLSVDLNPYIKFVVNKDYYLPKTFDNFVVFSEGALKDISITTTFNNDSTGMNIDNTNYREGSYRVPILRDPIGARYRGLEATVTVSWDTDLAILAETGDFEPYSSLKSVITKYRYSDRRI